MKTLDVAAVEISKLVKQFIVASELDLKYQVQTHPGEIPDLTVRFSGSEVTLLASDGRELLESLEILFREIRNPDKPELLSCSIVEA